MSARPTVIQIDEPLAPGRRLAVFAYGFRPFFLLAGIQAIVGVLVLSFHVATGTWPLEAMGPADWHFHELLFGFVVAAIAGFLLTAVPNWTGERGFAGMPLIFLTGLWLAGRVVLMPGLGLAPWLAAVVDLAFLPALGVLIGRAILRARNHRNLPVIAVLALLLVANSFFHCERLGLWDAGIDFAKRLGIDIVLFLVAMIGGRIVPAFTINGLRRFGLDLPLRPLPGIEIAAPASVVALLAVDLIMPNTPLAGWLAGLAALVHALRLARWHGLEARRDPLIWVLHLGYAWLVLGLALKAAWLAGDLAIGRHWLHAVTAGCFATMILAVMTRASLGHTGRRLIAPPLAVAAYVLTSLAALARVFGPHWDVLPAGAVIGVAAALWCAAMLAYLIAYAPILILRRADGKPG